MSVIPDYMGTCHLCQQLGLAFWTNEGGCAGVDGARHREGLRVCLQWLVLLYKMIGETLLSKGLPLPYIINKWQYLVGGRGPLGLTCSLDQCFSTRVLWHPASIITCENMVHELNLEISNRNLPCYNRSDLLWPFCVWLLFFFLQQNCSVVFLYSENE